MAKGHRSQAAAVGAPLEPHTYRQTVYETLRERIVELDLAPGERLVENDLAQGFQVSKTPVREALANLASDGLVDFVSFRGATVSWLSKSQMLEHRFLIDNLELPALKLVVERISDAQIANLRKLLVQMQSARGRADAKRYRALTSQMHEQIFNVTGYPRLVRFIRTLVGPVGLRYDRVFMDRYDDTWDLMLELSEKRVEGIGSRDADRTTADILTCREQITVANMSRVDDPSVAVYFDPDET